MRNHLFRHLRIRCQAVAHAEVEDDTGLLHDTGGLQSLVELERKRFLDKNVFAGMGSSLDEVRVRLGTGLNEHSVDAVVAEDAVGVRRRVFAAEHLQELLRPVLIEIAVGDR